MLGNLRDNGEPISIKVTEGKNNTFYYAVYYGDGSIEGSLCAAAGGYKSILDAFKDAENDYAKQVQIRSCVHDWTPRYGKRACTKCEIFDWNWKG